MAFKFPPLPEGVPLVGKDGSATRTWARFWQKVGSQIETQEQTQDQMLLDIQTALTNAGIALNSANALMPDVTSVTVTADYTGAVLSGQLPRNVAVTRFDGSNDVTSSSAWSAVTVSGEAAYTIGAATGILNITSITATTVIEVTSVYNGISRSRKVTVYKTLQDPPPSSSSGTQYDSSINSTNSTSYGAASAGPLTITCGASGQVDLSAPLTISVLAGIAPTGSYGAVGKWQYRPAGGGSWTDVAAEVSSSVSAASLANGTTSDGYISVAQSQSGLTPSSNYEFQLLLRSTNAADDTYYTGTASASTS